MFHPYPRLQRFLQYWGGIKSMWKLSEFWFYRRVSFFVWFEPIVHRLFALILNGSVFLVIFSYNEIELVYFTYSLLQISFNSMEPIVLGKTPSSKLRFGYVQEYELEKRDQRSDWGKWLQRRNIYRQLAVIYIRLWICAHSQSFKIVVDRVLAGKN